MPKIFFGADPSTFAREQSEHHRELADKFEGFRVEAERSGAKVAPGRQLVLDTGIEVHRWWAERWRHVADVAERWDDRPG